FRRQLAARTRAFESLSKDKNLVQPECKACATCSVSRVPAFNFVPNRSINWLDLSSMADQSVDWRRQSPVLIRDCSRIHISELGLPVRSRNARRHSNSASSLNKNAVEFFRTQCFLAIINRR